MRIRYTDLDPILAELEKRQDQPTIQTNRRRDDNPKRQIEEPSQEEARTERWWKFSS